MSGENKKQLYDDISNGLTNFECGLDEVKDLYSLLVRVQNIWEDIMTSDKDVPPVDNSKEIFTLIYPVETDGDNTYFTGTAGEIRDLMKRAVIYPYDSILVKGTVICVNSIKVS